MGRKGKRVFRNNYEGLMDKTKGAWIQGREVGIAGVGRGVVGGKGRQLYLNNYKIKKIVIKINK